MELTSSPTPSQVQALFNRIAPVYDPLNDWLSLGLHRVWKQMAVKWSQVQPGQSALDVCCGSGDLALLLARRVGIQGQVVGLDFSTAQLEMAKIRSRGLGQIKWIQGDALGLPFDDGSFDGATLGYGLRNVSDIPQCLSELYRVLRPGGWVAILDFSHPQELWLKNFQAWYLQQIVVPLAKTYNLTDEYTYLIPSLARYPKPPELITMAQAAGFQAVTFYPLMGGLMGVLVGQHP
ncbi:bifunctional demethylmenaquinone methyltransferase/2-methoxy-6-polyprenyl-1,4-benzoquinol methylase UbiE [Synechococcus sp. PCC 6312]|uniref:bifunctional demethylmenaquinone methyltransferase/2-methoxy-6-polyprenyl-1,4-benzoquinol methylase UbiE n=1 Tax=Synechococcus sp. (strain ATCC 27167 / PCC 6312) TaxID=195253 RepID=UPI00029F1B7D|nr:bifunctional demethylmenaquinone methyltransferase/2-methoxy-6-polyprenyl-1,4-benzoquinol methylase UbiE [Synechococcus sp. PCC 6312]AFY61083.1 ubiquinone/menaquinone biosynthesis methyltransferase [Synechococcus sp. PCC 6312]